MTKPKRYTRDRVLRSLQGRPMASAGQIGALLDLDHRLVRQHLKHLVVDGLAFVMPGTKPLMFTVRAELAKRPPVIDQPKSPEADKLPVKQTVVPAGQWSLDHPVPTARSAFEVGAA